MADRHKRDPMLAPAVIRRLADFFDRFGRAQVPVSDFRPSTMRTDELRAYLTAGRRYRQSDNAELVIGALMYGVALGVLAERRQTGDVDAAVILNNEKFGRVV